MLTRLRRTEQWRLFAVLLRVHPPLAVLWWALVVLRGALPALLAVALGALIGAIQDGQALGPSLTAVGLLFVALQTVPPLHLAVGANLGSLTSLWLNDRLMEACLAPPGMAHLERSDLADDLSTARDFDLGITGPPLSISMDFIADGLTGFASGIAAAILLAFFAWWAPLVVGGAWIATHVFLRESAIWQDRNTAEVMEAQRHAEYAYRLAVDPPAAKEVRVFGLAEWAVDRFRQRRVRLLELQLHATRLRERPTLWSLLVVVVANGLVFWAIAIRAIDGSLSMPSAIVFAQAAAGVSAIAFGGFSWALREAARPVQAVLRLQAAMATAGALPSGGRPAAGLPAREVRFRDVSFAYEGGAPVLDHFDLTIPAGTSIAIVGQNGAGKTTLAKLLCRLYDPQSGAIEVDGVPLAEIDLDAWRTRLTAVFQDFIRYELPLRENVAPLGLSDDIVRDALVEARAEGLATLETPLSRGYLGGTDLSGGQWQRVAIARALAAVRAGAGLVLLDEPTAQLDVRGEAEIFQRVLEATRDCTTILISHRFSTVRHADRICVLEHGRVVELGTHDELMALGGRYHTMFELQASRFGEDEEESDDSVA